MKTMLTILVLFCGLYAGASELNSCVVTDLDGTTNHGARAMHFDITCNIKSDYVSRADEAKLSNVGLCLVDTKIVEKHSVDLSSDPNIARDKRMGMVTPSKKTLSGQKRIYKLCEI